MDRVIMLLGSADCDKKHKKTKKKMPALWRMKGENKIQHIDNQDVDYWNQFQKFIDTKSLW